MFMDSETRIRAFFAVREGGRYAALIQTLAMECEPMRRVGQARRRDQNEKGIISALRAIGAHVTPISGPGAPDLLVRYKNRVFGLEVKTAKGKRKPLQEISQWPIVRDVDEALQAIGVAPEASEAAQG